MKRLALAVLAVCLVVCCAIGLIACEKSDADALAAPAQLELKSSGRLTWKGVEGAVGYEVSVNGTDYTAVEEEEIDIFTLVKDVSVTKIYVRAKSETQTSEAAELAVTVRQLAAPEKPTVSEDSETHAKQFHWPEVENANRYGVKVNDNENWVSIKNNFWTMTEDGAYSIAVKCLAYADGTTIYLESAASEESDEAVYIAGPLLYCDTLNEIYWQLEDGSSFARYDLWIDGKEAAKDVGYHGSEDPLDLVEEGYLTKTGEYDIQIKAVKEGDTFAWSNMLSEFGTGNINPNEFYSFDNRIFSTPIAKEGVGISDEKYYGESGYSLKIEPGSGGGQINLVKYEGALDDVDLRYVRGISYWVYFEPVSGVADTSVDTVDAFKVAYDDSLGNYQNRIYAAGKSDYEDGTTIPVNRWTKVTVDACLNEYDNVIILSWTVETGNNFTIYLDEILVETVETIPAETEYTAQYVPAAGWFSGAAAKVAENQMPGATVTMKMDLQTSADGIADENFALASLGAPTGSNAAWQDSYMKLDTSKTGWREVTFQAKVAADGCVYLGAVYMADDGHWASIYIRDVEIIPSYAVTFETNGGSDVADVMIAEGSSLSGFDSMYLSVKDNLVFEGWYTSATFEVGTRVGRDVLTMPANALTVYAKWGDAYEYAAEFDGTAGWFSGKAAKVAENLTPEDTVTLTVQLRTTLDGVADNNVALAAFGGAAAGNDTWQDSFIKFDTSITGWREVTFQAKVAADGCVYLGGIYMADAGTPFVLYMKDVEVIQSFAVIFEENGGSDVADTKIAEGMSLADFDANYKTEKANTIFEGWYTSATFEEGTRVGVDVVTMPANALTVYAKWGDAYEYKVHYYSNSGSWFGGEAARVSVEGAKAGDTVVLSMQVKTSQDGMEDSVVKLYQETAQWIDPTMGENYASGIMLSPATASGWREVSLTVKLTEDGYMWLAAGSENPDLGECFVYIKSLESSIVSPEYEVHYYSNSGSWFGGEAVHIPVEGAKAGDTVVLSMQVKTSQDGVAGSVIKLYQEKTQWIDSTMGANYASGIMLSPATASGWREVRLKVTLTEDGYVWLAAGSQNPGLGACDVTIKGVTALNGSLYIANNNASGGAWFGGESARVAVAGAKTGDTVVLELQIMTTLDGTDGATVKLYQTNSQWQGASSDENYDKAVSLLPAEAGGWRSVSIEVTLAEDGFVWLGVGNETSALGECFVYIYVSAE